MTSWLHHNQAKKRILPSHISNISYGNLIPPTQNTIIRPTSTKLNLFKPIPIIPTFSSLPLDLPIESLYTIDLALSKDDYDITISKINEFLKKYYKDNKKHQMLCMCQSKKLEVH